ncbi:hypothetical protein ACHAWT_004136 [Skeletonema menzelii]
MMTRLLKYLTIASLSCSAGALNSKVISNLADLPFDENDHLSAHILAFPASGPCGALVDAAIEETFLYGHTPIAVEREAAEKLFAEYSSSEQSAVTVTDCPAVCLDRGVDSSLVAYPLPEKYLNNESHEHDTFANFMASNACGRVEYGFINYSGKDLALYWVNQNTETYMYPFLQNERNTRFTSTFIGHTFRAKDPETGEVLLEHTVESNGVIGVGNHVNHHRKRDIRKEVRNTMGGEWRKHQLVKRTFSALGFDTGRLPNDVFGSMRAFYYNNRAPPHRLMEEWDSKGLYVNYWETDCNFIQIPWGLKFIWQERLKEVVQEWVGEEIEQTDLYGMRQYETGARLLTHVDRINTHAVSLIVNVAQGNLTEPWTVEVYDHADRLHEVVMEPGTIVYYESAKALHGRNSPLAGGFYTNLFTHYRPINDPEWYMKENPEGTPEPLIDVGKCELVGKPNEYSQGAVKCENDAIGPHLSPKMVTARSGDDLYDLWLSVGPSFEDDENALSDEL